MPPREAWMWPPPPLPGAPINAPNSSAYWEMNATERPNGSPSRYMMYRPEAEHVQMLSHHSQAQQAAAASQFFAAPQPPMFPYGMPMHPDFSQQFQRMGGGTNGYAFMPIPGYSMVDQAQMPMMMQVPPIGSNPYRFTPDDKAPGMLPLDTERRDSTLEETWDRLRSEEPEMRDHNMEELLALSRQAQLEAGGNTNVFVCPHCEKRYVGKHARSIWRRHLQDKHAIPLSVQPRRTRWDRDANRPRNAEERRERMLESKRRWARKKREQERRAASNRADSENTTETPAPEEAKPASPTPVLPTPKRPALAVRDTNVPVSRSDFAKSPLEPKMASPLPLLQSTPLRDWPAPPVSHSPERGAEPSKRSAAPASLSKRSALDRAALAAFSRVDPSPRVFPPSASKFESRFPYSDLQGSPIAASAKRDGRSGDQFSSPQHLNLTHSLGLAPHSASKNGSSFGSMYPGVSMTPMQGGITPYTKMPLGLTPTIGGLLRGDMASMPPSASGSAFLHNAGDLSVSNYLMSYTSLDTPSVDIARSARRRRHADASFHSSSEREEEEELDQENDQRNASPSIRYRPRSFVSKPLTHETPSKVPPSMRSIKLPTPRSPWQRTPHNHRLR